MSAGVPRAAGGYGTSGSRGEPGVFPSRSLLSRLTGSHISWVAPWRRNTAASESATIAQNKKWFTKSLELRYRW